MKKLLLYTTPVVIVVIVGFYFYYQINRSIEVETAPVNSSNLTQTVTAPGKLVTKEKQTVYAPITGAVTQVHIRNNQSVKQDDWLVTIKNPINNEETLVKASLDGVALFPPASMFGSNEIDEGAMVNQGQSIFTIEKVDFDFVGDFDQLDIKDIEINDNALITLDAFPEDEIDGYVEIISPSTKTDQAGETSVPITIHITSNIPEPRLLGMTGDVSITTHEKSGLTVPLDALDSDGDNDIVYIIRSDEAVKKNVVLGDIFNDSVEVLAGLSSGESVITSSLNKISDGTKVEVK